MLKILSTLEYEKLLAGLPSLPLRDQSIVLCMLHAGLRNGEVRSLVWNNVRAGDIVRPIIEVRGGHISHAIREVPISPMLNEVFDKYFSYQLLYFPNTTGVDRVFSSKISGGPLSARDLQRLVGKISLLSIGRTVHPHVLRHTFASRLVSKTSIRVVQELLGHRSLTSTQVYTHPTPDDRALAILNTF